jgi:AcrR family transcriptional regulator
MARRRHTAIKRPGHALASAQLSPKRRPALEEQRKPALPASQLRLLAAGKTLFAQLGYEQTSTSAIARRAGTSESQLVRYFDGKRGLLAAIFDQSWGPLNRRLGESVARMTDSSAAIRMVLSSVMAAFESDAELAYLFLFEGRRIRASAPEFALSRGYLEFVQLLDGLIRQAQTERTIPATIDAAALCSALIGAAEGMMRDRLIVQRSGLAQPFSPQQVHRVFAALLDGMDLMRIHAGGRRNQPPHRRQAAARRKTTR